MLGEAGGAAWPSSVAPVLVEMQSLIFPSTGFYGTRTSTTLGLHLK